MTRRFAAVLSGSALLLALAACSDSTSIETKTEDTSPALSQGELGYLNQHVHVMPPKSQAQEAHAKPGGGSGGSGTGIFYHGGRVLNATHATRVVAIYWSASNAIYTGGPTPGNGTVGTAAGDGSLVGYFLRNLGGSPYFNINTTYTDGTGAVPNSVEYRGYFADKTSAPSGTQSVSDAQMQAEIVRAINAGYGNDGHTIYLIFTEGKVNLGGGFGSSYCAYHGHLTINGQDALYAAMPYDYAYPGACTNGTAAPNGDPGADAEVNTLAHEIEEAATDPDLNAWYDRRGYENADKCAWTWGSTYNNGTGVANLKIGSKDFLIQRNWINSGSGGCYKGLGSSGPIS